MHVLKQLVRTNGNIHNRDEIITEKYYMYGAVFIDVNWKVFNELWLEIAEHNVKSWRH